jgi:transcriptional regulator with XRE-family HTH domain
MLTKIRVVPFLNADYNIIMNDNIKTPPPFGRIGRQIRQLRRSFGWSLAILAKRAGTSATALHRYETGWDRFEIATLRRIASALDAQLEIRLVKKKNKPQTGKIKPDTLVKLLSPLFWDRGLTRDDLHEYPLWVANRAMMFGNLNQVRVARDFFGDDVFKKAVNMRGVDERTRNYWNLILAGGKNAPKGSQQ